MEHTEAVHTNIDRYFGILGAAGSYPESRTHKLLLYAFLVDTVLDGEFGDYLDDAGLLLINRLLVCLSHDACLTVVQQTHSRISKPRGLPRSLRIAESETLRIAETDDLRKPESNLN